jgi:phosphatidylinositol alpha-1,6-mannosyltransferase
VVKDKLRNKILLVSSEFPPGPGGIGTHAYSLAISLVELGYDVNVLTLADYAAQTEILQFDLNNSELNIIRLKRLRIGITQCYRVFMYLKLILFKNPDVIIHSGRFGLYCSIFNVLNRKKIFSVVHGSEVRPCYALERYINQIAIRNSKAIICVSQFTADLVVKYIKRLDRRRIYVIENALLDKLLSTWDYKESNHKACNKNTNLKLLTVGNVIPRKGQQNVIKALPVIKRKYRGVLYDIVGSPNNTVVLNKLISDLNLFENVKIHGKVKEYKDLRNFFVESDIFLILSENMPDGDVEGYGIVVLEANFFGVPVIGSKGTGIEAAIQDGFNGRLVDANNSDEILAAINDIMINYQVYRENSIEWSKINNWRTRIKQYIELL